MNHPLYTGWGKLFGTNFACRLRDDGSRYSLTKNAKRKPISTSTESLFYCEMIII